MRYLVLIVLLFSVSGCVAEKKAVVVEKPKAVKKVYHGEMRKKYMLGTLLGCSNHKVQWGFTKEECGELWFMKFDVSWGEQ